MYKKNTHQGKIWIPKFAITVIYVSLWMMGSSHACDTHQNTDAPTIAGQNAALESNITGQGHEFTSFAGVGNGHGYETGFKFAGMLKSREATPMESDVYAGNHGGLQSGDTVELHCVDSTAQAVPGTSRVRPKVMKVNPQTVDQWCNGNTFKEDHAHGVHDLWFKKVFFHVFATEDAHRLAHG